MEKYVVEGRPSQRQGGYNNIVNNNPTKSILILYEYKGPGSLWKLEITCISRFWKILIHF